MATEYLIGIDIGTSRIKTVAYDLQGTVLASRVLVNPIVYPQPGWSHFEALAITEAVLSSLAGLASELSGLQPLAIGVASIGEAGFLLDRHGGVLYPAITWFDHRTEGYQERLNQVISESDLFASSGMNPDHIYSLDKILWLRDHEPTLFEKAVHWLCMEDFVIYLLTGEMVTDYTIACRTVAFDRRSKSWNRGLLEQLGIAPNLFVKALPSGTAVAHLRKEVAQQCHLPTSVMVCTGGHDHICAAFAIGMTEAGCLMDSMGTAEAVKTVLTALPEDTVVMKGHFDCYPHVVEARYILSGHNPAAGAFWGWIRREMGGDSNTFFETISQRAFTSPPGAYGVTFLPFMEGSGTPDGQRTASAALFGLRLSTTQSDLIRAFFEGMSFWLLDNLRTIEGIMGRQVERILVTGGGSKNTVWLKIKADVLGHELVVVELVESTALGAAFLAGRGSGVFSTYQEASQQIKRSFKIIQPNLDTHQEYQHLFRNAYFHRKRLVLNVGAVKNT
jgi:xylulokinase